MSENKSITVAELIRQLNTMPPEAEIIFDGWDSWESIVSVRQEDDVVIIGSEKKEADHGNGS